MLYQRYFLRMNQTNMTHLLGLLLAVAVGLTTVQISTLIIAQNFIGGLFSFTEATYFETQYEYVYKNYIIILYYIFCVNIIIYKLLYGR